MQGLREAVVALGCCERGCVRSDLLQTSYGGERARPSARLRRRPRSVAHTGVDSPRETRGSINIAAWPTNRQRVRTFLLDWQRPVGVVDARQAGG